MEKEITLNDLYSLIVCFQENVENQLKEIRKEMADIKNTVEITKEHVAEISERLHEVEKVKRLFDQRILEKIG